MQSIDYRHWQPGDDDGVMAILGPQGWCSPERYAAKFADAGLRPADILIAEQAGRIVGHLMVPHRRLCFGRTTVPFGGIGMVVVDPLVRGQGVGARLLELAMAHHQAAGNQLVGLLTHRSLIPAYPMYQRRGFVEIGRRVILTVPRAALGPAPQGWRARPVVATDRPALAELVAAWAVDHHGVSQEAGQEWAEDDWAIIDKNDRLVGRYQLVARPTGYRLRRLMAFTGIPLRSVLAVTPPERGLDPLPIATTVECRAYPELAELATAEEEDGVLMVALLSLVGLLASLSLEIAGRLREAGAPPARLILGRSGHEEAVAIGWADGVLQLDRPTVTDPPPLQLDNRDWIRGVSGQPPPLPSAAPAALWLALFPPRWTEARLVDCW